MCLSELFSERIHSLTEPIHRSFDRQLQYSVSSPAVQVEGTIAINNKPVTLKASVIDPASRLLCSLKQSLERLNIMVNATSLARCSGSDWSLAFSMPSFDLLTVMNKTLHESDNTLAEIFLRTLGVTQSDSHATTAVSNAEQQGLVAVKQVRETSRTVYQEVIAY